jgi:dTDP-4-amino-4,6-dideoxygalactose transaminase
LRVKLKYLDQWNSRRAGIADRYTSALQDAGLILPTVPSWAEPIWHLYVVQHPQRDLLQESLSQAGIGTLIHYPIPPHLQQAYAGYGFAAGQFPIAERMAKQLLSLPLGPQMQDSDVDKVIAPIPGTSSVAHLEENVAAAALKLPDEDFQTLSDINPAPANYRD